MEQRKPQERKVVSPEPVLPYQKEAIELYECEDCNRKFNEKAFEKHVKVCKKVFMEKRKAYDSKMNRMTEDQLKLEDNNK